jgi:ser/thr protein phosphatase family protein
MGKVILIGGLIILLIILIMYFRSEYEKNNFVLIKYKFESDKIKTAKKFIFISDLHDKQFGKDNEKLIEAIEECKPDFIVIGGDMMVTKGLVDLKPSLLFCEKISKKYKVYYANGNHELRMKNEKYGDLYSVLNKAVKEMGIYRLEDSCEKIEEICIYGLDIDKKYYKKLDNAEFDNTYIEEKLGSVSKDKFNILLAHSPLFLNAYAKWGADLVLSGHFHGGTVRVWKDIGLMTPQIHFFSDMVHGLKKKDATDLIISSGLGTHSINIRLNDRAELILIELLPLHKGKD